MNFAEEAVSRAREDKDYATMYLAMAVGELQKQLTSPPQRQPLTDEELFKLWDEDTSCDMPDTFTQFKHTARAIEAAILEKQK